MDNSISFFSSLMRPEKRAEAICKENKQFLEQIHTNNSWSTKEMTRSNALSKFELILFSILNPIVKVFDRKYNLIDDLFLENKMGKSIQNMQRKIIKLNISHPTSNQSPYLSTAGKLQLYATKQRFQALKAQASAKKMGAIQNSPEKMNVRFHSLPKKLQNVIRNIAEMQIAKESQIAKETKSLEGMLNYLLSIKNKQGENVYDQIEKLLTKKQSLYLDFALLKTIRKKIADGDTIDDMTSDINALGEHSHQRLSQGQAFKNISPEILLKRLNQLIGVIESEIPKIDHAFKDILQKVDRSLSIYEISSNRLTNEISPDILNKPISVTMVSAEYLGLAKEGGLAEAVQGMAVAIKNQHPDNEVRMILPKFNKPEIAKLCEGKTPEVFRDNTGKEHHVYKVKVTDSNSPFHGIEFNFIEHSIFELKGEKPSIYDEYQQERFPLFSGLAADLLKQSSKTDIIHLHDWHAAGVALRLKSDNADEWKEGKIPPVVFTYHNNNRATQGRLGCGAYNYGPVIQGLINAGIAVKDTNVLLETLQAADAITTVSETFGIESQMMGEKKGEGISFAIRQAAAMGKLTGVINGSNPEAWNPDTNPVLKNWKEIERNAQTGKLVKTDKTLSLAFNANSPNILDQKKLAKEQLAKWVEMVQEAEKDNPQKLMSGKVDFSKPLVTFIGRFDSYQKGIDKLEEAIVATLKSGGQFVVMGADQKDETANKILEQLQKKYPKGVLFIRDYTDSKTGRLHYQLGTPDCPAIGPVVRAATEYVIVPSSYEPCGLVQFEAWLFGSLAIGSNTGGLADTIVPPGRTGQSFNGFLFEREGNKSMSLAKIIPQALKTWKDFSPEQKKDKMKEVMDNTKSFSWSTASEGYSPAEKYRFVYENARNLTPLRGKEAGQFNLDHYYHLVRDEDRIPTIPVASEKIKQEEEYLRLYTENKLDSDSLDKLYEALHPDLRWVVPSPYGRNVNFQAYQEFGSHVNGDTTQFKISAPNASSVQLKIIGDGSSTYHNMKRENDGSWTWAGSAPVGTKYQYRVNGKKVKENGKKVQEIIDPYGLQQVPNEDPSKPPYSVVTNRDSHDWNDKSWMQNRQETAAQPKPMSIYEVHTAAWKKKNGEPLNYREIADELVKHCKNSGHTHVELMGILEHPCDDTWANAYQVTGFYAPNHRMGSVDDFKYLVDTLHNNKIGVILDFVSAHFAKDSYSLDALDIYEDTPTSFFRNPREYLLKRKRQKMYDWGTNFFNFKKKPVREFLFSSAAYWLKEMHIDGLRVDAVKTVLFTEKRDNTLFLKDLNAIVHQNFPGAITIAEDYSSSASTFAYTIGGLGFDYKWHFGWVNKLFEFFGKPITSRAKHYNQIIAAVESDQHHRQVMALSHDETTKELKTLLEKTPGLNQEEKFANLRTMLSFMMCLPGKKLMMMGSEFGMAENWTDYAGKDANGQPLKSEGLIDSPELNSDYGQKTLACVKAFNDLYRTNPALFEKDQPTFMNPKDLKKGKEKNVKIENEDLQWLVKNDPQKQVVAYRRSDAKAGQSIACFHNFTNTPSKEVKIKLSDKLSAKIASEGGKSQQSIEIVINSDDTKFGGKGTIKNHLIELQKDTGGSYFYTVALPPLSTVVIQEC